MTGVVDDETSPGPRGTEDGALSSRSEEEDRGLTSHKEESPAYKLMFSTKCGNGSERFRAGPKRVAVRFEPPSQGPTDNMSFTGIKAGVLLFIMKDDDVIGPGRGSTRTEQVPQPKAEDLCNAQ